jgi:hypothetical protein
MLAVAIALPKVAVEFVKVGYRFCRGELDQAEREDFVEFSHCLMGMARSQGAVIAGLMVFLMMLVNYRVKRIYLETEPLGSVSSG